MVPFARVRRRAKGMSIPYGGTNERNGVPITIESPGVVSAWRTM
jgi:hypothetical protein